MSDDLQDMNCHEEYRCTIEQISGRQGNRLVLYVVHHSEDYRIKVRHQMD